MLGEKGDPDTGRDVQAHVRDVERVGQRAANLLGDSEGGLAVGRCAEDQCEFVAAHPREGVALIEHALQGDGQRFIVLARSCGLAKLRFVWGRQVSRQRP